jgi:hypothetical protein
MGHRPSSPQPPIPKYLGNDFTEDVRYRHSSISHLYKVAIVPANEYHVSKGNNSSTEVAISGPTSTTFERTDRSIKVVDDRLGCQASSKLVTFLTATKPGILKSNLSSSNIGAYSRPVKPRRQVTFDENFPVAVAIAEVECLGPVEGVHGDTDQKDASTYNNVKPVESSAEEAMRNTHGAQVENTDFDDDTAIEMPPTSGQSDRIRKCSIISVDQGFSTRPLSMDQLSSYFVHSSPALSDSGFNRRTEMADFISLEPSIPHLGPRQSTPASRVRSEIPETQFSVPKHSYKLGSPELVDCATRKGDFLSFPYVVFQILSPYFIIYVLKEVP